MLVVSVLFRVDAAGMLLRIWLFKMRVRVGLDLGNNFGAAITNECIVYCAVSKMLH